MSVREFFRQIATLRRLARQMRDARSSGSDTD
jgi:hypothetical protein